MKKKILGAVIFFVFAFSMMACGKKTECFFCGEVKKCEARSVEGEKVYICKDCAGIIDDLGKETGKAQNSSENQDMAVIKNIVQIAAAECPDCMAGKSVSFYFKGKMTDDDIISGGTAEELKEFFQNIDTSVNNGEKYYTSKEGTYYIVSVGSGGSVSVKKSDIKVGQIPKKTENGKDTSGTNDTSSEYADTQPFDPFENIEVTFSGIAPEGKVSILDKNDLFGLSFQPSKDFGLANGDVVEITLGTSMGEDIYKYCAQYGYKPSQVKKSYTVSGLNHYAEKLADIPNETIAEMVQQQYDAMTAYVAQKWNSNNEKMEGFKYIGSYYLVPKMGATVDVNNYLYLIFEQSAANEGNNWEVFKYYYYTCYENIVLDENGNCLVDIYEYSVSEGTMSYGVLSGEAFSVGHYFYKGYEKLEDLKSKHILSRLDKYKYETTLE